MMKPELLAGVNRTTIAGQLFKVGIRIAGRLHSSTTSGARSGFSTPHRNLSGSAQALRPNSPPDSHGSELAASSEPCSARRLAPLRYEVARRCVSPGRSRVSANRSIAAKRHTSTDAISCHARVSIQPAERPLSFDRITCPSSSARRIWLSCEPSCGLRALLSSRLCRREVWHCRLPQISSGHLGP